MAGVKITDLGTIATAASDDLLYIVDVSDTSQSPEGTSKQIEVGNMFSSGSYTPTISGETNLTAATNAATYIRVGNVVTVSIQLDIQYDASENSGLFEVSLPVASDFTTIKQCFGLLQWSYAGTESEIEVVTEQLSMQYCTIQFQYEIV
jgi:hypothetical protein